MAGPASPRHTTPQTRPMFRGRNALDHVNPRLGQIWHDAKKQLKVLTAKIKELVRWLFAQIKGLVAAGALAIGSMLPERASTQVTSLLQQLSGRRNGPSST